MIHFRALLASFKNELKLMEGQNSPTWKEKVGATVEQDACNTSVGRLQVLFDRFRGALAHVLKRLSDKSLRLKAGPR